MRSSILFSVATIFAGFATAAPTSAEGHSAVFHMKNLKIAFNPETEKTDLAFDIKGTSRFRFARFGEVSCSAASDKKTSGELHAVQFSLCEADDDVRFELKPHDEGWALMVMNLRSRWGPQDHPYDQATYIFPKEEVVTIGEGQNAYEAIQGPEVSDGFEMKAKWHKGHIGPNPAK